MSVSRAGVAQIGSPGPADSMPRPNRARNAGIALRPEMFEGHAVNRSAAERRAETLTTRRSVKKANQAAWLVNAIRCMDLTTLSGDDTEGRVRRLCAKARQPLAPLIAEGLGIADMGLSTAAVCVSTAVQNPATRRRKTRPGGSGLRHGARAYQ